MKHFLLTICMTAAALTSGAAVIKVNVDTTKCQKVTGFGAAACSGLMAPIQDVNVIKLLYGPDSKVGLNIVRMEISPNTIGDVTTPWDTPYDWHGYLPVIREAKKRGAIIFGTPWSPPSAFKTNNTAQGGNSESQGFQRGKLKTSYYSKFFTWLNSFCAYMKNNNAAVDIVAIQNEPDWWVDYSGCLYTPTEMYNLVKQYASRLEKEKYGVRLMGGESFYYNPAYTDSLLNDPETSKYIDLIGGHIYGNPPLDNMARACKTATAQGKETWMTEHSVNPRGEGPNAVIDLPTWHEELEFAEELNESMMAGISAYVYWYMVAQWSFVGSGDKTLQPGNDYGKLLRRGLIMSHYSKHVTGATRLTTTSNIASWSKAFETTAYQKQDSLIVIAIDTTAKAHTLQLNLPYQVKAAKRIISTKDNVCKTEALPVSEGSLTQTYDLPARSIATYVFIIDWAATGINRPTVESSRDIEVYTLQGQKIKTATDMKTAVEGLAKGIYIIGGKKIMI